MTFRLTLGIVVLTFSLASGAGAPFPDPAFDDALATAPAQATAVLAGGCFWGVEAVFEHLKGVTDVMSGYSGGSAETATYELASRAASGHAEAVQVTYDSSQVSYGRLLKLFFDVAHDPTEVNRQGPDIGPQYRSVIFYSDDSQKRIATAYIAQLNTARILGRVIATQVVPLQAFYPAEPYHQNYAARHPYDPYIFMYDRPKVALFQDRYPELYVARR
jgi:peptide-methionine (S)-S-oxide reductase